MSSTELPLKTEAKLRDLLDKYASRPDTGRISFALSSPRRAWTWNYESEATQQSYFIASITKLYTTAVLLQLRDEKRLELEDPIASHLDVATVEGLNTFGGVDRSRDITIRDLMAHTSGIAGYFDQKRRDGGTLLNDILRADRAWTVPEAIGIAKRDMPSQFAPGTPGKAFYSDTNFHLLGMIIESLTGSSWEAAVHDRIILPLQLNETWAFDAQTIGRYAEVAPMLHGQHPVHIPQAMTSVRAHGGLVSTAPDGIAFLQAFVGGALFDSRALRELSGAWRRIFFPLQYGTGLMRYAMPKFLSPGSGPREYLGHSGSSGTVLFYAPETDLFISGNVSQIKNRALVYRLMSRLGSIAR